MQAHSRTTETLTLTGAEFVAGRAQSRATMPICVVVVNARGGVLFAKCDDAAPPTAFEAALLKARGAARSGIPTHQVAEFLKTLPAAIAQQALALPDVCAFQGGMPIKTAAGVIGGVGIAGGSGDQDVEIATHASRLAE